MHQTSFIGQPNNNVPWGRVDREPGQRVTVAPRRISKSAIAEDVRSGFPDQDVMTRHGLTKSQYSVVLNTLQTEGLLDTIHTCPACGLRATVPIDECPRCGLVIAKFKPRQAPRETLWAKVWRLAGEARDFVDCGGYNALMRLKKKWESRL